jgi:hypothetical protein
MRANGEPRKAARPCARSSKLLAWSKTPMNFLDSARARDRCSALAPMTSQQATEKKTRMTSTTFTGTDACSTS